MMQLPVALQSLVVQGAAVVLTLGAAWGLHAATAYPPRLWQLALVQGAIAAALSRAWSQPGWWWGLHAGFLPAALFARTLDIPPWVYLAAFFLLVLFYWTSFRTRVPLYLSGRRAWDAVATLLPQAEHFRFIDLGSGLGGVPLELERRFPRGRFHGAEIAPAPWLISRLRARLQGSGVNFQRRDYATLDLADFDVVFAFLSPAAMPELWRQARTQMRTGSLFISRAFPVESRPPDHVLCQAAGPRHTLYAWRM